MNARLMAVWAIGGSVLAALVLSPQTSAQNASSKGLFSTLKVGQMVEYTSDSVGAVIRTYEDAESRALMTARIREIGEDFIALDVEDKVNLGTTLEFRTPIYRFSAVTHVGKKGAKPGTKKKAG